MARFLGLVAGSLTGAVLGAILVAAACSWAESAGWVRFGKEPLLNVALGMAAGAGLGGVVGLRAVTGKAERRGPDEPL